MSVVLLCFLHRNFYLFCLQKKNFYVMRHRTLEFKSQNIERKVTESKKIKNMPAVIWTFWISGARFHIFYSLVPCSQNMKKLTFPRPKKSKFLCKHVNSYSARRNQFNQGFCISLSAETKVVVVDNLHCHS